MRLGGKLFRWCGWAYQGYLETTETIQIVNPTGLADAREFAGYINEVCHASSKDFDTLEGLYDLLGDEAKAFLLNAHYTVTGSGDNTIVTKASDTHCELAEAMSRYDELVNKHGMTNFMNKAGLSSLNQHSILGKLTNSTATTVVIIISVLGLTTLGGYFFLRKKKEEN